MCERQGKARTHVQLDGDQGTLVLSCSRLLTWNAHCSNVGRSLR